jgi:drug/metabolite transporter (DMT)-like permease
MLRGRFPAARSLLCARLHLGDRITPSAGAALLFSFAGIVLILGADPPPLLVLSGHAASLTPY